MTERRQFSRVAYRAPAVISSKEATATCQVLDMSLHGVCTTPPSGAAMLVIGDIAQICVDIPDSDVQLRMDVELVSLDNHHLRFRIDQIDLESITYLKRMIELNLGDEALLHREIQHLSYIVQEEHDQ